MIFKHCLKVLEENIDLSNHTYLNSFKETVNVIFQHRLKVLKENIHLSSPAFLLYL